MPDSYTVQPGDDTLYDISRALGISYQELMTLNPQLASRTPPYSVVAGEVISIPHVLPLGSVVDPCTTCTDCIFHQLGTPFLIATATDPNIVAVTSVTTPDGTLSFGQDATSRSSATIP